ncbi:hypothetical protein [Streptomyces pseudovenezuelae]|uniref:Integral membrane protein n=1 Tax=Streptomyces pseudovenezuelae TaxID=67350 RepID=A0ABT6LEY9_9ACTN|nr:hypothetical protein [Streptomyces pseudovenezuelae]MDH6214876.1 hypothetical protein [Streptomyces pseudovenezuelae]
MIRSSADGMLMGMDITSLTVVLSVIVVVTASVLIVANEPPLWVYALTCVGSWLPSAALLKAPAFVTGVGHSTVGEWAVRLALTSTLTAAVSFFVGKDSRGGAGEDATDGPPTPRPTA